MPVPTHVVNVVSLFLCLSLLALQNGCSNSGSGDAQAPAINPAATLSLALTTTNGVTAIVADGQSTVPIRMTVANGVGTPMSGVSVTFATTNGTLSPSPVVRVAQGLSRTDLDAVSRANGNSLTANTDTNGIAQVLLTASTTAGVAIVTADVQGFRVNIDISFAAGPAARVQLDTSTSTVSAGGPATLTATVTDANGNRVPGETVIFTLSTNTSGASFNSNGASFSSLSGVTDVNGQATVQYTAGTTAGADTVRVVATGTGVTGSTSITVTAPSGGAVSSAITSISVANGATGPVIANGVNTVAVRATMQGASGPLSSIPVTFSTTAGSFAASTTTATATTNASGIVTVNLIAPMSPGTATVTASASGFSASTSITFVAGAPATVQLVANPTTVNPNATSSITARVTDAQGNPVSAQTLTFTTPSRGTLSVLTGITDTNGQFAVTYTAGATPATDTIQVRTVNGITGTLSITITPASGATSISIASGVTGPVIANGVNAVAIRATVQGSSGPLSGSTVTFTTTAGTFAASVTTAEATTNASGIATVNLIAPTSPGTATVTASASGFSASTTITFVAGAAAVVQLVANPTTVNPNATSSITARVTDAQGNPVSAQTLTFTAPSRGTLSALTGITDTNGQFAVTYTAGATPATDTIQVRTVNGITGTLSITITPASGASRVDLFVSSPQLGSNGIGSVTLTALVRNAANNVVSGGLVSFAADSGNIQVTNGITAVDGTATAILSTRGNPQNRTITVTATTGGLSSTNTVQVVGTTLNVSGATRLVLGATTRLTILLQDSGRVGIQNQLITITSSSANPLSATTVMTDASGQATVDVTASFTGTDTIQATAPGVATTVTLSISADNFVIRVPAPDAQVPLNAPQAVTMHWDQAGVNQVGQTINFFATRGNFTTTLTCPTTTVAMISAITNASGDATVNICSDNAGPSVISAAANVLSGPSSQVEIEFVATIPALLILHATVTSLAPNQQSIITAVVRDAQDNLVKNQTVSFSVSDVSAGQIAPGFGITDSFGRASTVFTASPVTSGHESVMITASTALGTVADTISLTVAQQALFVVLGTANQVQPLSPTQYALPYSVLVTDANGTPVANAIVALDIVPTQYRKGICGTPTITCPNEDGLFDPNLTNGIRDLNPDEDINGNNSLDPGNVAAVPTTVSTDATGFAFFDVVYAQEFAGLVEVDLNASTVVVGSERSSQARFFLPGACIVPPVAPFGVGTTCDDPE